MPLAKLSNSLLKFLQEILTIRDAKIRIFEFGLNIYETKVKNICLVPMTNMIGTEKRVSLIHTYHFATLTSTLD